MSFLRNESFFLNNNEEQKPKLLKKRTSNFSVKNMSKSKSNLDLPNPMGMNKLNNLNKSFSKLNRFKKNSLTNKSEVNILKDYLHSHKFGIQRKKTRRITVKPQEMINGMNNNLNKSDLLIRKSQENKSMIYYQNEKKQKKLAKEMENINKTEKPNLKIIENSIILKLNSMRMNYQNETVHEHDTLNGYFENDLLKTNSINSTYSNRSNNDNLRDSLNSLNIKNLTNKNKTNMSNYFKRRNSSNYNSSHHKTSNINASNHHSSAFTHNKLGNNQKNNNNNAKYKSEIINNSFDKQILEKIDKGKLDLTDINLSQKYKKYKKSSRSISTNNEIKEKERARNIYRIKPLYDSFDDDESDKDEERNEGGSLHPNSSIIFFLDFFLFLSSIYCLFYIPLRMARDNCFCGEDSKFNKIILYLADVIYIFDFCISFFRGYYNYQLKLILNNNKIVAHYIKSDGIFDFLEAIPLYTYTEFLCLKAKEVNQCFSYSMSNSLIVLKTLTNLKIFKVLKVRNKQKNVTFNYLFDLFSENYFLEKLVDNFMDFTFCFLAFHFFICLNIFLSKNTFPSWMIEINTDDKSLIHNYIASSYSLTETLTTVGYGDVVCQSNIERIFQIFFLAIGVVAYSYLISSFGNLFKNESQSSIKYNNNMKILEEIRVDYPNMPYKLYNKIYNHIESRNMAEKKSDSNILTNSLPFNLKNALLLIMYQNDIKHFKFFRNCENSNFIIQVLSNIVPATSKKYEFLVYEGEMIEDIVIVKDGRLSLEAAIDMEDPETSIQNYFNNNFKGITTDKELKKLNEGKRESTSQIIQSNKTQDFDKAKNVLSHAVKKQANYLFNEACDEPSILDKTRNDNNRKEGKMMNTGIDYLKNEPIKNEKGNFKYIKILDIRKNENFGGLYMFMRRPSPLSLKVRSKFAELYMLPKKEVFNIAKNYSNIWSKIHRKDFHNMLSIKHQTFNILNKFIEMNGMGKISPNDVSRYVYAWELPTGKSKRGDLFEKENRGFPLAKKNSSQICPSPITLNQNISPMNFSYNFHKNNLISNQSNDNVPHLNYHPNQPQQHQVPTEMDFSNLLTLMAYEKQKKANMINDSNNMNINTLNTHTNIINTNNDNSGTYDGKDSLSQSFTSNFFKNKQKTNNTGNSNEDGKTIILPKGSEKSLPTLNNIFNENKAEEIKEEMKKSRKKENRRKIFSFGKKTAELFRNKNYSIYLVGKDNNECIEIRNKIESPKSLIKNNDDFNELSNYISFCQDNIFLDKIPEISSSEEYSTHQFDKKDLAQDGCISFTLESIYQNINVYSNLKYSQNKTYQEKTLNYLNKLINNIDKTSSSGSSSSSSSSSDLSRSNSFSQYFSHFDDRNRERNLDSRNSKIQRSQSGIVSNSIISSQKLEALNEDSLKSDNTKKNRKNKRSSVVNSINPNKKILGDNGFKLNGSIFSKNLDLDGNDKKKHGFKSMNPKNIYNLDTISKKRQSDTFKKTDKLNIKIDKIESSCVDKSSYNDNNNNANNTNINSTNSKLKKKIKSMHSFVVEKNSNVNQMKNSLFLFKDSNNIKTIKNSQISKKLSLEFNKNVDKTKTSKYTKRKSKLKMRVKPALSMKNKMHLFNGLKSEQKLISEDAQSDRNNEGIIKNSMAYFAKEEKEECIII